MALATDTEANDWLQSLCQAVAEGLQVRFVYLFLAKAGSY